MHEDFGRCVSIIKQQVQGGQKTVDNFAMVKGRKACDMSKVPNFCLEKHKLACQYIYIFFSLFAQIFIHMKWCNYTEFDKIVWILPNFKTLNIQWEVDIHKRERKGFGKCEHGRMG